MKEVVKRTNEFVHRWGLSASSIDLESSCNAFLEEMERGLHTTSSLQMIPTYVKADSPIIPNQRAIVLDAGGTNFRVCTLYFNEKMEPVIENFQKIRMPGSHQEVSAKEFFSVLANQVEPLIELSDYIGFCFSYPAQILESHEGIALPFTKEIKAREVVGMPLGHSLLAELERRGHSIENKKVAVLNDTVATLLAGKTAQGVSPYSGYVGFILGTGTNTAYVENNSSITKLSHLLEGSQIINVESGGYSLILGDLDEKFNEMTENPGAYRFEKMISGAYLGSFSQVAIEQAIEEGLFSSEFARRFKEITPLSTTRMSHYLEMPHNKEYDLVRCITNEEEATTLYLLLNSIIERAAKLTAVNLSAAVLKSKVATNPRYPLCINADGTTFYKTAFLKEYTEYYISQFLKGEHHRYVEFVSIDNSPTIGAAVAALSLM